MELTKGDYIIYNHSLGKHQFAQLLAVNDKRAKVRNEGKKEGEVEPAIEILRSAIVANLGHSPSTGSVYGVKVEPVQRTDEHSFWGDIRLYVKYDDDQYKLFRKWLKRAQVQIEEKNLPKPSIELEVRQQSGKYDGMYKFRPKLDNDILIVRPRLEFDQMDYVLYHEYAHGIWFRHMTPKQHMRWVRMYNETVILQKPTEKELQRMCSDLMENGDIMSYNKELDEEQRKVFKAILRHIKQVHSIERHHLSLMLEQKEELQPLWPSSVELGDKNVILTEYATKNPEELFAETMAFYMTARKLPKRLAGLLDESLRVLIK